jgi:hypothetical protein
MNVFFELIIMLSIAQLTLVAIFCLIDMLVSPKDMSDRLLAKSWKRIIICLIPFLWVFPVFKYAWNGIKSTPWK